VRRNRAQDPRELGLREARALRERLAAGKEESARRGVAREKLGTLGGIGRELAVNGEAVFREADRRLHQGAEVAAPAARKEIREAAQETGHGRRTRAIGGNRLHRLAPRGKGRAPGAVEPRDLRGFGIVDERIDIAAQARGIGAHHGEDERRGRRGVRRIAAVAQHAQRRLARERVPGRDNAARAARHLRLHGSVSRIGSGFVARR